MKKFWQNAPSYCSKKLGVYEVRTNEYQQIVLACQKFRDSNSSALTTPKRHRYIGLITIREPIERSLSAIHQRCNVHSSDLDNETQGVCERCNYNEKGDQLFFEKIVKDTNDAYTGLKEFILSSPSSIDIPFYVLDMEHLSEFVGKLQDTIDKRVRNKFVDQDNRTFHFPKGKSNAEAAMKLCDFGMPSALMKQHHEALETYHGVWSGEYLSMHYQRTASNYPL